MDNDPLFGDLFFQMSCTLSSLQGLFGPVFQLQRPQHVPPVHGVSGALRLLHAGADPVGSGKSYYSYSWGETEVCVFISLKSILPHILKESGLSTTKAL